MKFIAIICTVPLVLGSLQSSSTADMLQLASDLDRISPGASDWFVKWAQEERLLDMIEVAMSGRPVPPNAPKDLVNLASVGYYVLYKNPSISMTGFISTTNTLARSLNVSVSQTRLAKFFTQQLSYTTCPQWLHNHLSNLHRVGMNRPSIIENIQQQILQHPELKNEFGFAIGSEERHFDVQLATLVRIWMDYCIDAPADACVLNMETMKWEPSALTRARINRFMLLVILRK